MPLTGADETLTSENTPMPTYWPFVIRADAASLEQGIHRYLASGLQCRGAHPTMSALQARDGRLRFSAACTIRIDGRHVDY
jgi:hypothetical protein